MADDKSLEIRIKTTADLSGAQAAESGLDRAVAQAESLGQALEDLDAQRSNLAEPTASPAENPTNPAPVPAANANSNAATNPPPQPAGAVIPPKERTEPALKSQRVEDRAKGSAQNTTSRVVPQGAVVADESPVIAAAGSTSATTDRQISFAPPRAASVSVPENLESPATSGAGPIPCRQENLGGDTSAAVRAVERQTQAMIAAGEKLRAALEENGAATVSTLQRLLAAVGDTNLKLGALERRLAELEGRVRGAMNR